MLLQKEIWIDPALPIFIGHFPGNPILPAFEILSIVREMLSLDSESVCFENIKFLMPIRPDYRVLLVAEKKGNCYNFTLSRDATIVTSGRIVIQ